MLDPRPKPPARAGFGTRDLYSFYDLCGRIYPGMGALYDQTVGGLIIWIPTAMMSVLALVLVLNALRRSEERTVNDEFNDKNTAQASVQARQPTG